MVDVGDGQAGGVGAGVVSEGRQEAPLAVAAGRCSRCWCRAGPVRDAVVIEVGDADDLGRAWPGEATGLAKRPAPRPSSRLNVFEPGSIATRSGGPPRVNAPAATPEVASRVVRVAEPSACRHAVQAAAGAVQHGRGEGPVAPVAQDADLTGGLVGDDDVRGTVAIDIRCQGHVRDAEADRQGHRGREEGVAGRIAPGTVVEKDREGAVARIAHHQVVPAVAVEVGRDDLRRKQTGGERPDPDEVPSRSRTARSHCRWRPRWRAPGLG